MLGNIILLSLTLFFLLKKMEKGLLVIILISLFNDLFQVPLINIKTYQLIVLIYSPTAIAYWIRNAHPLKHKLYSLIIEYYYLIILGLIFGFLHPWQGDYDHLRSWSQLAEGRTIVQLIRLFSEISSIFVVFYWLQTKKITLSFMGKSMSIILVLMVIAAISDGLTNYLIRSLLFGEEARLILGRFMGLNGEPRAFGKMCSYGLLFLLVMKGELSNKVIKAGIVFSVIGIIISFSASTYVFTFIWFIILVFYRTIKLKGVSLIIIFSIFISMYYLVNNNNFISNITIGKLEKTFSNQKTLIEKVDMLEPDIFTRFEVFDRAALNFLYREPLYFIIGVGPNLISIPSSPYLTRSTYAIYGENIDSVPHSFIINLLSRSGLIGLFLWLVFFMQMYHCLRKKPPILKVFFVAIFISNFIVSSACFYLYLGVIVFLYSNSSKNKIYD